MDCVSVILKAFEFIRNEYSENIFVADVAERVYLSPSYFSYIFRTITGYAVKDYINRYRLYRAAVDLKQTDKRLIDIAIQHGFQSQQAFAKSFKQTYRITPAQFRRLNPVLNSFPPENLLEERRISMEIKKSFDNAKFVKKDSFFVIGIETDINYNSKTGTASIGGLYERWNGEKLIEKIPDKIHHDTTYGMTLETNENDEAKYIVCVEVSSLENIPAGFVGRRIDACGYAVFDTTLDVIWSGDFWKHFHRIWLKEQGLEQPDTIFTKKKNSVSSFPYIELYDENWKDEKSVMQVYAPVIIK